MYLHNFLQVLRNYKLTQEERQLKIDFIKIRSKVNDNKNSNNILLLPIYDDYGKLKLSFSILETISKTNPINLKYFHVNTAVDNNEYYSTQNEFKKIYYRFKNTLKRKKLENIFSINSRDIIATNFQNFELQQNFTDITEKKKVLQIKVKDVLIGDLVYDHYLRFFEKPTIDVNDVQLYNIIHYARLLVEYWIEKLNKININFIVIPYTAYLHWGIIARVALNKNIKVINIGSSLYILQTLEKIHPYHSKNFHLYDKIWQSLEDKEQKLISAKSKLVNRLNGSIDDLSYMKQSAYSTLSSNSLVKTKEKNAIIFLHCFFDSPHIYGKGLFADFFEWVDHILNIAKENPNINYYLKQHPNGLEGNYEIVNYFKNKYITYENIIYLNKNVSNLEIIEFKPDTIFTFYGTVAHEFAYLQFPVILAGDSPMKNYKFCYQPKNINEFNYYINEVGNYTIPYDYDDNDLLSFYYMHYIYFTKKFNSDNFNLSKNFNDDNFNIPVDVDLINLYFN
jgi:hypothetical protein